MNKTKKIILIHLILFNVLVATLLFTSELILNIVLPGVHGVNQWLQLNVFGTVLIFVLTLVSCIVFLLYNRKKLRSYE